MSWPAPNQPIDSRDAFEDALAALGRDKPDDLHAQLMGLFAAAAGSDAEEIHTGLTGSFAPVANPGDWARMPAHVLAIDRSEYDGSSLHAIPVAALDAAWIERLALAHDTAVTCGEPVFAEGAAALLVLTALDGGEFHERWRRLFDDVEAAHRTVPPAQEVTRDQFPWMPQRNLDRMNGKEPKVLPTAAEIEMAAATDWNQPYIHQYAQLADRRFVGVCLIRTYNSG